MHAFGNNSLQRITVFGNLISFPLDDRVFTNKVNDFLNYFCENAPLENKKNQIWESNDYVWFISQKLWVETELKVLKKFCGLTTVFPWKYYSDATVPI